MNTVPEIKELPFTAKEFPDENWAFIEGEVAGKIPMKDHQDEALLYEGARLLYTKEQKNERAFQFLISITDGYFPNYPFLMLSDSIREGFLKSIRDPKRYAEYSIYIGQRYFSQPIAVKGHIQYALHPELENDLEQVAEQTATDLSEKHEGTSKEDFLPPWTQAEEAVRRARNQMIAQDDERIDHSLCLISVNVDFNYTNTEIAREFEKLIKDERKKHDQKVTKNRRGKKKTKAEMLRDLAVYRLYKEKGSRKAAVKFLEDNSNSGILFESAKGWNGAKKSAEEELEHLRFCLGISD